MQIWTPLICATRSIIDSGDNVTGIQLQWKRVWEEEEAAASRLTPTDEMMTLLIILKFIHESGIWIFNDRHIHHYRGYRLNLERH